MLIDKLYEKFFETIEKNIGDSQHAELRISTNSVKMKYTGVSDSFEEYMNIFLNDRFSNEPVIGLVHFMNKIIGKTDGIVQVELSVYHTKNEKHRFFATMQKAELGDGMRISVPITDRNIEPFLPDYSEFTEMVKTVIE